MAASPPARDRQTSPRRTGPAPAAPDSTGSARSTPVPLGPDLPLPHERDQSDDSAPPDASPDVVRQAARDLEAGLVDTDLRGTPGADAQQRDALLRREAERTGGQP